MDEKAFSNDEIHSLRKDIDGVTQKVRRLADMRPREGGAELTLSFRSLQLAKMWLGKVLEEVGSELPAEYADKA